MTECGARHPVETRVSCTLEAGHGVYRPVSSALSVYDHAAPGIGVWWTDESTPAVEHKHDPWCSDPSAHATYPSEPRTMRCDVSAGSALDAVCSCGHQARVHRIRPEGGIVCGECQLADREVSRRLERLEGKIDRLIDVVISHLNRDPDTVILDESIPGPTDYEIWADALSLALKDCHPDGTDEYKLQRALFWRNQLKRPIRDAPHSEYQSEPLIDECRKPHCPAPHEHD